MLSMRRLLRIILAVVILVLFWARAAREYHERPVMWLAGGITLSVILLLVLLMEINSARRKGRKPRDEVPKHPLGLDS